MIKIGDIVNVDGIECTVFYIDEEKIYAIDNHGAGYYYNGIEDNDVSGNALRYEWGAYNIKVETTNYGIGGGILNTQVALANENCFIPLGNGSKTIWSVLKELREQRSNRWFIGNSDEYDCIYKYNINLHNINTSEYYWTSNTTTEGYAVVRNLTHETDSNLSKNNNIFLILMCTISHNEINNANIIISHNEGGEIRFCHRAGSGLAAGAEL